MQADNEKVKGRIFHATDNDTQTHSKDGVDLTLIRWMLSLTPRQRLEALQENVQSIMRLKNGVTQT